MRHAQPQDQALPRIAIYARYSTDMQQPVSVERQVRTCREYAERQGWGRIPDRAVYADEAVSGSNRGRTEYQRLLGEIATSNGRPPCDIILIEDLSRLMRDMSETDRLVKMAPVWNVRVIGVNDGVDSSRKGAKQFMYLKGMMAEGYLDELKDRIRGGLRERFLQGYHPGGTVYGYRSIPVPHPAGRLDHFGRPILAGHKLEIDSGQAAVVRRIFTEAATGLSPRTIAAGLHRDGVPKPCHSYNLTRGASRAKKPWNGGTVFRILLNERYRGLWRSQQTVGVGRDADTGKKVMRAAPGGVTLEQHREALRLVDDKLWNTVQDILDARADGVRRDPKTGRLAGREKGCATSTIFGKQLNALNGLLKCGVCGGSFAVLMSKPGADGRRVRYLGCMHRHHFANHCTNAGVCRLPDLEASLGEALRGYFSDANLVEAHHRRFLQALAEHRTRQSAEEQQARAELAAADLEISRVKQPALAGLTSDTIKEMDHDARAKREEAVKRLAEAEAARRAEPRLVPPQDILAGLNARRRQERREAYQRLLLEVRLRSERGAGRRMVTRWTAEIIPRPEAGMTGLPKSVAFGKDFITVGPPPSERGGLSVCAGG